MLFSATKAKLEFWLYRLATVSKSFKTLYTLPAEKIDAFLNSYDIYDHDWTDEKALIARFGSDYPSKMKQKLIDYYSVLNHLCAVGQVEKMYIPPAMDLSQSIIANQALFEKKMAKDLGLQPGKKVLDIGCGRGRVANHIASFTGADVTGINIDPNQLESAERFARVKKLSHQCHFQMADLNQLPLPFKANSLDAVYEIQVVFSLAKDLVSVFKDIHRVLKPGGLFASLEWACLDKYNPQNSHHAELMRRIKPLIGAIGARSLSECVGALKKAGFELVINENASLDGLQAPMIENADKFFTRIAALIKFCVKSRILPAHFKTLFDRLTKDGQAFVEADRLRLVTTSHYIVARKL